MRSAGLLVAVVTLVALARPSLADPTAQEIQAASQHVQRGDHFKKLKEYMKAAREYEKAYELVPHPELFYNLGQVYRLDKQRAKAIEYYERYLAVDPNGRAAAPARAIIAKLKAEKDDGTDDGGTADDPGDDEPIEVHITDGPVKPPIEGGHDATTGRGLRIAGGVTAGAGLVSLALGVKFGLDARSISNQLTTHTGPWSNDLLALQAVGKADDTRMIVFSAVGAVALIGGGVLYYLGYTAGQTEADAPVVVVPTVAPDGVGLALDGSF